ncbi:hypothetical protein ACFGVR_01305 [Mucilaginibacter sp. AW1-3]
MNNLKKISVALIVMIGSLLLNHEKAAAQQTGFYQYSVSDPSQHSFSFGNDPNTCPSYYVNAYEDIYIEADDGNGGNSYYFSLISGDPSSYFNYGGYGMLYLEPGQYAILKADFATPSGIVSKYVYFYNF